MKANSKLAAVSAPDLEWMREAEFEQVNQGWLDKSRRIALRVLFVLKERGISQTELAVRMGISRQMVSKIVRGKENFKLSTIDSLEKALAIDLFGIPGDVEITSPLVKALEVDHSSS